MKCNRNW